MAKKKGKEKVIIFDGEDKFVKPREYSYDINTGKSEFVGGDGVGNTKDPSSNIPPPNTEVKDTISGGSGMPLPTLGSANFCVNLQNYISTNGGGSATPDQTMAAYDMFQRYCNRPEDRTTTSTTTSTTTAAPVTNTTPTAPSVPVVPLVAVANLGVRPMGGGGGGGGSEDAAPEEKKKSYWWLLLVVLGIYLVAKKKKD